MINGRMKAIACGKLFEELGLDVDCYVLEDGRRVISQRGILRALRGKNAGKSNGAKDGDLGRFLERLPNASEHLTNGAEIDFDVPLPQGGTVPAIGREGTFLVDLCDAYADAFIANKLHHTQEKMAKMAISLIRALAKTGIEALIDEATGYERSKAERELSRRFSVYLRTDVDKWEVRFPPSLVQALAPLYRITYTGGSYPRALQTPFHMIYNMVFGGEVADEMRQRNPNPDTYCHHQMLQPPGHKMLSNELAVVELLARQSGTKDEFWGRMRAKYLGEPLQLGFA